LGSVISAQTALSLGFYQATPKRNPSSRLCTFSNPLTALVSKSLLLTA